MIKNLKQILVILLLFNVSITHLNAQILLREVSLENQITNSSLVIEGKVISKKSFWGSDGIIYTSNTVEVYKVFKGELVSTINVITEGGTVGLRALNVSSSLKLREGDTGIFTLQESNVLNKVTNKSLKAQYKTYGAVQGFYKYNLFDNVATNPFNSKKGISNSFYNEIINITKNTYTNIIQYDVSSIVSKLNQTSKMQSPTAITFSPTTVTAGTKTKITITIPGGATGNFGTLKGKVAFSDADLGGNGNYIDALDSQVTWSSSTITVEVPSSAGTGKIRVTNNDTTSRISTIDLTVTDSELNVEHDSGTGKMAYRVQHISDNGDGGYKLEMQTDFFNDSEHPGAKAAFKRAFDNWICATGINWKISSSATTKDVIGIADLIAPFDGELDADGVNVIRFDNGNELPDNVLGNCYSWYSGCTAGSTLNWYVIELDIVFDDATDWNFGPAQTPNIIGKYDFESVALHELGHGHQLGHVIDNTDVMNYALQTTLDRRILGSSNIARASIIQSRSTTINPCPSLGTSVMTNLSCPLSVNNEELKDAISIYPNPTRGTFNIKNNSLINLEKVDIYDIRGRLISSFDMTNSSRIFTVNLFGASKGMYFVNVYSNSAMVTKKIVLE